MTGDSTSYSSPDPIIGSELQVVIPFLLRRGSHKGLEMETLVMEGMEVMYLPMQRPVIDWSSCQNLFSLILSWQLV